MNNILKKGIVVSALYFLVGTNLFASNNAYANFDFESGQKVKLGTLYVNDSKVANPTNPTTGGNVPSYKNLGVGSEINIKDTDSDEAYQISWVPVKVDGKKYLSQIEIY